MSVEERLLKLEAYAADVREFSRLLMDAVRSHDERFDIHQQWVSELGTAQVELTKAQARTEAAIAETNERLNSFIDVLERHLSGNGDKTS